MARSFRGARAARSAPEDVGARDEGRGRMCTGAAADAVFSGEAGNGRSANKQFQTWGIALGQEIDHMSDAAGKLNAVQRHRQRLAMGRAVLSVEVDFNGLSAALIDAGFLFERDCDDR